MMLIVMIMIVIITMIMIIMILMIIINNSDNNDCYNDNGDSNYQEYLAIPNHINILSLPALCPIPPQLRYINLKNKT